VGITKCELLPSLPLSTEEKKALSNTPWKNFKLITHTEHLGVPLGQKIDELDIFRKPLEKFHTRLDDTRNLPN
jgi:hypothetical protein